MEPTRVILCQDSARMGQAKASLGEEGLAAILRRSPTINLVGTIDSAAIEQTLEREDFKVLVLPAAVRPESDLRQFLDVRPDVAILVIDLAGPETSVRFHDLNGETLARIINALSEPATSRAATVERIHWLRSEDLRVLGQAEKNADAADAYPDAQAHLTDVKRWIALSLFALIPATEEESETTLPGWTMNSAQARALLSDSILNVDPESLWETIRKRERASREKRQDLPLLRIADVFRMEEDETEKKLLWHVLGPELDGRFGRVHGYLNDDLTRRRPTLTRLAQIVDSGHDAWSLRKLLAGTRPLARHKLISVHLSDLHGMPATEDSVAPAPELVDFLLLDGTQSLGRDSGVTLLAEYGATPPQAIDDEAAVVVEHLFRAAGEMRAPLFRLDGGREAEASFTRNVRSAGLPVLRADLAMLTDLSADRLLSVAHAWARLALLHNAVLLITGLDSRPDARDCAKLLAERLPDLVPVLVLHGASIDVGAGGRPVRMISPSKLTIEARGRLWYERARAAGLNLSREAADRLAAMARYDEVQIDAAIGIARGLAPPQTTDQAAALCEAVRRIARADAPSAVQVVECGFRWNDIILADDVLAQLRSIPEHVRHAGRVLEQWGYGQRMPYGHGVAALFSGASGTGKSMAAQIVACDLCTVLYRIDLSKTVSKWLGETEKILSRIFDLAQQNSAVLFFDEADVLFAKRTEVKDAHDRYANVEVAYLLQRMEDYDGLAILTTNLKQNIDPAFLRRLRFVVDFPLPGPEDREKIWRLAFPRQARLASDVDFTFLARRLSLTGGNIQQIAIRAAFAAAAERPGDADVLIAMRHVLAATRHELLKLGMLSAEHGLAQIAVDRAASAREARA